MALFDRYTTYRLKQIGTELTDRFLGGLSALLSTCNANVMSRLISLASLTAAIMLIAGVVALFKPAPEIPASRRLVLKETDSQGVVWTLNPLKNKHNQTIVKTDKQTGPPLTLTVQFYQKSRQLLILPEISGSGGEQYFPGIAKNGKWQPPPTLEITAANGTLLHRGQFEYG